MISLKKYFGSEDSRPTIESLMRSMSLILEGIALNAIESGTADRGRFQETIRRLNQEIQEKQEDSAAILATSGAVIHVIDAYNEAVVRQHRDQQKELRSLLTMLLGEVSKSLQGNDTAVLSLGAIETQVRQASEVDDIRQLKSKLVDCLSTVQKEAVRQAESTTLARKALDQAMSTDAVKAALGESADQVTGLMGRESALRALARAIESPAGAFAIPLIPERLALLRGRFGPEAANYVLHFVVQAVSQRLRASDALFRWNEESLLAVLERTTSQEMVRMELTRQLPAKMECTVRIGDRSILLPVSVSWMIMQVTQDQGVDSLSAQLDAFVKKKS